MYEQKFAEAFRPIETPELLIRHFLPSDGHDLAELLTDPKVVYYEPYPVFSREEAIAEAEKLAESDCLFAVELKAERKVIGKLYFHHEGRCGTYELGYTVHRAYQGRGLAKAAAAALIGFAFESGSVRRIIAYSDETNTRSWNLLEHLGFRREGELRKYCYKHLDEDGQPLWQNMLIYAMLAEDAGTEVQAG